MPLVVDRRGKCSYILALNISICHAKLHGIIYKHRDNKFVFEERDSRRKHEMTEDHRDFFDAVFPSFFRSSVEEISNLKSGIDLNMLATSEGTSTSSSRCKDEGTFG